MFLRRKASYEDTFLQASQAVDRFASETERLVIRLEPSVDPAEVSLGLPDDSDDGVAAVEASHDERRRLLGTVIHRLDLLSEAAFLQLDQVRMPTRSERLAGRFSRRLMWRRHNRRLRLSSAVGRLVDLIAKTDEVLTLLRRYQQVANLARDATEECAARLGRHRRQLLSDRETALKDQKKIAARALVLAGRIGLYGDEDDQHRMQEERKTLLAEAKILEKKAGQLRVEADLVIEAAIKMEALVACFNRDVAVANALLRKVILDAEERDVGYRAHVDLGAAAAGFVGSSAPSLTLPAYELGRRKSIAESTFLKLFPEYMPAEHATGAPLIDMAMRRIPRWRLRFRL
ncbi:hypothetical protein [Oryzifoliimicrobium ureilyticus]|uniref:hypothetical protein n=1 Tax=Oryzifoliimicrobium ureilyticus TaxID=3113724 RepID=UPI0030766C48